MEERRDAERWEADEPDDGMDPEPFPGGNLV
jgi:hypothetical protein